MRVDRPHTSLAASCLGLSLLLVGSVGCGSNTPSDKVDAGQRKYCDAWCATDGVRDSLSVGGVDGGQSLDAGGGFDALGDVRADRVMADAGGQVAEAGGLDASDASAEVSSDKPDLLPDLLEDRPSSAGPEATDSPLLDLPPDAPPILADLPPSDPPASDSRDTPPDLSRDTTDAPLDNFPVTPTDGPGDLPESGDLAIEAPDSQLAAGPEVPDGAPADADAPILPLDGPMDVAAEASSQPSTCLIGAAPWAKMWPHSAQLQSLTVSGDGIPWAGGVLFAGFDFGSGSTVPSTDLAGAGGGVGDGFLVKLDAQTGLALAGFGFGDPDGTGSQTVTRVAVASSGNVAVIGTVSGEIDFTEKNSGTDGATAGFDYLLNSNQVWYYAVFDKASTGTHPTPIKAHMASLGTQGVLSAIGSNPSQSAFVVCGKADGIAVKVYTPLDATKSGIMFPAAGTAGTGKDIVVAKIAGDTGDVVWGKQFGGAGDQVCNSVALDGNGDVTLVGQYKGTLDFGGSTTALPVQSGLAPLMFVAKLSGTDGTAMVAKTWGADNPTNYLSGSLTIAADLANSLFLGGGTEKDIDFGGGVTLTHVGTDSNVLNAFVVKLSSDLVPQWAKLYGGATGGQFVSGLATTSAGDVLVTGAYVGSLGNELGLPTNSSLTAQDVFLAQLTANGQKTCASAYGDLAGNQQTSTIASAPSATGGAKDMVLLGGQFSSTIQFGSTPVLDSGSTGTTDFFVARMAQQ